MVMRRHRSTRRWVHCALLGHMAPGLEEPPLPGDLGRRIFREISSEAWQRWLEHQQILINEQQLISANPRTLESLIEPMQQFLFENAGKGVLPSGYRNDSN